MDNQEKSIILTPAIAMFEKIISEIASLNNDTHPELVKLKKEQDDRISHEFSKLDKQSEYQKKQIRLQCQCEIQQAQDEYEDFVFSQKPNDS